MAFIGSVTELGLVWNLADLFMALMALVNLAAIAIIGRYAYRALDDYVKQKKPVSRTRNSIRNVWVICAAYSAGLEIKTRKLFSKSIGCN